MLDASVSNSLAPSTLFYPMSTCSGGGLDGDTASWIPRFPHPPDPLRCTAWDPSRVETFSYPLSTPLRTCCDACVLCTNNNSAISPTNSPSQKSSTMARLSDMRQPSSASAIQPSASSTSPDTVLYNTSRVNMLRDLLNKVTHIASGEHIQLSFNDEPVAEDLQSHAVSAETLVEFTSSDVDGPTASDSRIELEQYESKTDDSLSTQSEHEPTPSPTSHRKIHDGLAEAEPQSSAVDSSMFLKQQFGSTSAWDEDGDDQNEAIVSEPLSFPKVMEESPATESNTSAFACVRASKNGISNAHTQEVPECVQILRNSLENRLEITNSEDSISVQKKESLSEQTGVEISHSELPADPENSEAGIPVACDTEQRSSIDRSISSSVPNLEKRQKQGTIKSLRQRQSAPARVPDDIVEDDQVSFDLASSAGGTHRIEALSGDSQYLNQQQFRRLHGFHDHHAYLNDAHVRPRMARARLEHSYNTSFVVMIGLCLTTVFVLLNHLYALVIL